jgi:alpha-tubulin suppressor-like RCC1 family protein
MRVGSRRRWAIGVAFALTTVSLGSIETGAVSGATSTVLVTGAVPAVSHLQISHVTASTLILSWQLPAKAVVVGALVREAASRFAPTAPSKGVGLGNVARPGHALTVNHLAASTWYSFAVFAHDRHGHFAKAASISVRTADTPLAVQTKTLVDGTVGLTYLQKLSATGGNGTYAWSATGLPSGLSVSTAGVIKGFPSSKGSFGISVTVTDPGSRPKRAQLHLSVIDALPGQCQRQSCSILTPDGHTVQVPATDISSVVRGNTGAVDQVTVAGTTVSAGDVLVLAPTTNLPSGLIAVADTITDNGNGTRTVDVTPATPADAYDEGTVQELGSAGAGSAVAQLGAPRRTFVEKPADVDLSCDGGVTSELHGLSVTPSFTPSLAAIWKHPFFGGGGIYVGSGGLSLFQLDLDGSITVNLGIEVSGEATCTLSPPGIDEAYPAGDLGAVLLTLDPSITLNVSGDIDVQTSITLSCGVEYRWDQGKEYRTSYCVPSHQPLQLSADSGVDATVTGAIDATLTLDDLVGVQGSIDASLHAGYDPTAHPVAEIDAESDYDLTACLACFWDDSPAQVTIVKGTLFQKTLATYDTSPPPTTGTVTAITGDINGYCAIVSGAAKCWGDNAYGELGNGTTAGPETCGTDPCSTTPVPVSGLTSGVAAITSGGGSNYCAIVAGAAKCWGNNLDGWLGNGTTSGPDICVIGPYNDSCSTTPVPVAGLSNGVTTIAVGFGGYCAIIDGAAKCWGENINGELGDGTVASSDKPVPVTGLTSDVSAITSGFGGSCAIVAGAAKCWGYNGDGELGDGTTTGPENCGSGGPCSTTPVQVTGLTSDVTAITGGAQNNCAIAGGGAKCWGINSDGQLGDGTTTGRDAPASVTGLTSGVTSIASDGDGYCAIVSGGAQCWGDNGDGQLGDGTSTGPEMCVIPPYTEPEPCSPTPVQVTGLTSGVTSITSDGGGYCAIVSGAAQCWGPDNNGELGDGTTSGPETCGTDPCSTTPVEVSGLTSGVAAITNGADGYCAIVSGAAKCWGSNNNGELGDGTTTSSDSPVSVKGL